MDIEVRRFEFGDKYTIGRMYIDGEYFCYTLEDKVRVGEKVPGATAIPYGQYSVSSSYSGHFLREMPVLLNVPNFSEIRIHPGNTDRDTEGCILIGGTWTGGDNIGNSRAVFDSFWSRFSEVNIATITISNGGQTT